MRPGDGNGGFGQPVGTFNSLAGHDLVTVAGDLDGDGHADLVARDPATGRLDAYLGNGQSGFTVKQLGDSWGKYDVIAGPGDVDGDGRPDLVARGADGAFYLVPGIGGRRLRRAGADPAAAGTATTPSPATATSTATARSTCWCAPAGSSKVFVKPNRGNGRFGHPLGPVDGLRRATGLNAGASAYGGSAPDLLARIGRHRRAAAQRRHLRDR